MSKEKNLNYMVYRLLHGEETVYINITNNINRRNTEHLSEGKQFNFILASSDPMTEEEAMKSKSEALELHRKNNQGKNPKYNDSDSG